MTCFLVHSYRCLTFMVILLHYLNISSRLRLSCDSFWCTISISSSRSSRANSLVLRLLVSFFIDSSAASHSSFLCSIKLRQCSRRDFMPFAYSFELCPSCVRHDVQFASWLNVRRMSLAVLDWYRLYWVQSYLRLSHSVLSSRFIKSNLSFSLSFLSEVHFRLKISSS